MSDKRLLIGTCVILGAAAASFWILNQEAPDLPETSTQERVQAPEPEPSPTASPSADPAKSEQQKPTPPAPEVLERLAAMTDRRPDMQFDPEEVAEAMNEDQAWSTEDNPDLADRFDLDEEDLYDGRKFVQLNTLKIETLQPGDTMAIPIPQEAEQFEMTVTEVVNNQDGTVTWRGRVNGYDRQNQVTITKDGYNTYFSMFTPDLNYVVHGKGDAAYVVDSGTLFKVPEGAETDVVYPDHYRGPRDYP